jgi:hypothetical protein
MNNKTIKKEKKIKKCTLDPKKNERIVLINSC